MSVTTKRIVDSRIEPQPDPVYATTVSPVQNQWYKIPASGLSNSYITFNNLTTLGADRAYLDTFELEITAEITLTAKTAAPDSKYSVQGVLQDYYDCGARHKWTFDSFPFNKCCEEIRVNINGGAFFSSPLSYLRAKERYWDEDKISKSYNGQCPCHKPVLQNELGLKYKAGDVNTPPWINYRLIRESNRLPTRTHAGSQFQTTASGTDSSINNSHVPYYILGQTTGNTTTFTVTWREPIFASPFSSKIDANYGRPLYNITSIDIAMNMQDLRNMIVSTDANSTYTVNLTQCQLCYQVETVPPGIAPSMTVVPYRRFVPYVVDYPTAITGDDITTVNIKSGAYTFNEVPTAIWIFLGPTKAELQQYSEDSYRVSNSDPSTEFKLPGSYNRTFGFVKNLNLSLANTTQILSTATPEDLFRICKANGLQDSFTSWGQEVNPNSYGTYVMYSLADESVPYIMDGRRLVAPGVGSVVRLIPGTDIVLPDQPLIPGANANNMVFNMEGTFAVPPLPKEFNKVALWILFEYVGVAKITPGQCDITMNPLGNGTIMNSAPLESASANEEVSTTEGSGWLDTIKQIGGLVKNTGLVGNLASLIPGVGPIVSTAAKALGWGKEGVKRPPPLRGGATLGLGDFC